jgi:hypothetical protein
MLETGSFFNGRGLNYSRSEEEEPLLGRHKGNSSLLFPTVGPPYIATAGLSKSEYLSNLPKYPKANLDTYLTCQISSLTIILDQCVIYSLSITRRFIP